MSVPPAVAGGSTTATKPQVVLILIQVRRIVRNVSNTYFIPVRSHNRFISNGGINYAQIKESSTHCEKVQKHQGSIEGLIQGSQENQASLYTACRPDPGCKWWQR